MESVEHIVIGGGAMGLATAWQLAKAGREVLLIEQFKLDHNLGSSHGATRIFRVSYRDPLYTNLALTGIPLWRELEAETNSVLLEQTGQIDHGNDEALADVMNCLGRHDLAFEVLDKASAESRWPGMTIDNKVVFSPDGGRANAALTSQNLARRITELNVRILENTRVEKITVTGDRVIVETGNDTFQTSSVVVAAGGWINKLLAGLVPLPKLTVDVGQPAHYQPIEKLSTAQYWPSFIHHGDQRRVETNLAFSAYGLFSPGEGMKIGTWANTPPIDPDQRDLTINPELLARQNEYVRAWFPGLDADTAQATSCLFTNTPDEHFVLDRFGPITVCSPCSGHGYKFVPIIGKITAELAMGGTQNIAQWKLPV